MMRQNEVLVVGECGKHSKVDLVVIQLLNENGGSMIKITNTK